MPVSVITMHDDTDIDTSWMAQGISANGNELKGFLQLRSSSSPSAVLQQVYCELNARRLEVLLFDYLRDVLLCPLVFGLPAPFLSIR